MPRVKETLSEEQRARLIRFQGACYVIGSYDGCARWSLLGVAIETALAALDRGGALMAGHREKLEAYLARPDAGRGMEGIEDAFRSLLAATQRPGADQEQRPRPSQARRSIASVSAANGRDAEVDLTALIDECSTVIMERPRDGSPPMVAISADVVRTVAAFAQSLAGAVGQTKRPGETRAWQEFVAKGPTVSGDGAADALGSVVHPIHVSAVYKISVGGFEVATPWLFTENSTWLSTCPHVQIELTNDEGPTLCCQACGKRWTFVPSGETPRYCAKTDPKYPGMLANCGGSQSARVTITESQAHERLK